MVEVHVISVRDPKTGETASAAVDDTDTEISLYIRAGLVYADAARHASAWAHDNGLEYAEYSKELPGAFEPRMERKEMALFFKTIKHVYGRLSFTGCDDTPAGTWAGWTLEERQALIQEFHAWNGDPEEYLPDMLELSNGAILAFLAAKATNQL